MEVRDELEKRMKKLQEMGARAGVLEAKGYRARAGVLEGRCPGLDGH